MGKEKPTKVTVITDSKLPPPIRYCLYARKSMEAEKPKKIYTRSGKSSLKNIKLKEKTRTETIKISKEQKEAIAEQLASFFFDFWENKNGRK